jgi:hypothetical protein
MRPSGWCGMEAGHGGEGRGEAQRRVGGSGWTTEAKKLEPQTNRG